MYTRIGSWFLVAALVACGATIMTAAQSGQGNHRSTTANKSAAAAFTPAKAIGAVSEAYKAYLNGNEVPVGTTVFAGDTVRTDVGGGLRLRLGENRLSLPSNSGAVVGQSMDATKITIGQGTVSFSSTVKTPLVVVTPVGEVHASKGAEASGEVSILGPKTIGVSAQRGSLVLEYEGETYTIAEGKADSLSLQPPDPLAADRTAAQHMEGVGDPRMQSHQHRDRIVVDAIILGGAAMTAGCLWGYSESPSGFCSF